MSSPNSLTRRDVLRTGLAGGAFLTLPAGLYRAALLAQEPPSERIRTGHIGVGNQGRSNLRAFQKNAVAICDVDLRHLATAGNDAEKAEAFDDYRHLLDRKDIDAVVISTPDHWHALMTVHACQAGKDVYCEKPLTLTIAEGKAMVAAAQRHKRIVQTGSQQRSAREFRQACELVRNGALGKVHTVKVGLPAPNWVARAKQPVPDSKPPMLLNYDLWLGPAPERPYNQHRVHYLFRFFWDYSGGQQTNFGAHDLDITQWALGMDESGPVTAEGTARYHPQGWYETPDWTDITYTYANGVTVKCGQGYPGGCTFEGEKGTIHVRRGRIEVKPVEVQSHTGDVKLYVSTNHHQNWLDCIKTRKPPICDVAIGHRSATVCHLGNIAIRLGRKITWDPAKEEIVGDSEAAKWVTKEYRAPWKLT
jgi:predicted dehydrogenase